MIYLHKLAITTLLLLASTALSTLEAKGEKATDEIRINGVNYPGDAIDKEEELFPELTAEAAVNLGTPVRETKERRLKEELKKSSSSCFSEIKEAASAGDCSIAFAAHDSSCSDKKNLGCFENSEFRKKLKLNGYQITEDIDSSDESTCSSLKVQWCIKPNHFRDGLE